MRTAVIIAVIAAFAVRILSAQLGRPAPPTSANPLARDQAAVAAGQQRFQQHCTGCHGRTGEGGQGEGQGPNLVNSWEVRRAPDTELMAWIHDGVKGTAMPAFPLPPDQIRALAAFVRSLNAPASSVPVPGDSAKGEALFFGKAGCGNCHMIRGRGGYLGPDLSNAGASRRVAEIRSAILEPATLSPSGYERVLLPGGVRAIVRSRTNWSMDVLDENGQVHMLHGDAIHAAKLESGSWMPSDYRKRLSPGDIDDLVAFLSRQTVRAANENDRSRPRAAQEQPN
jgi:cytochrome c oxidase cbb3-type subunit 3